MYNIYSKKPTTQNYETQNVVQIIESICTNSPSKCIFCGGKIFWNPCVINRNTKKRLPLSEKYLKHGTEPKKHICIKQEYEIKPVDWEAYHKSQENKFCGECTNHFNSYLTPLCPNCFKLECWKCHHQQIWYSYKDSHKCEKCGENTDVRQVWNAYQRLYGKYTW